MNNRFLHKFIFFLILLPMTLVAQNLEPAMVFPDTLRSANDSVYLDSPKWGKEYRFGISKEEVINMGTYGYKGVHFKIWTDVDTLIVPHVNHPYEQLIKIPLVSSKDTTTAILRFQATNSNFDNSYVIENKGKFGFEIPETYELANIILYLSECSKKTNNYFDDTAYAQKIEEHFSRLNNHKLIQILNQQCSNPDYWDNYYGFRENSIAFKFMGAFLEYETPYKQVYWDSSGIGGGHFRNMLYLVQDFANKSNFREFYKKNTDYYDKLLLRQSELLPIKQMWLWLEEQFPQKMDSYKIIFSPLIGGSHSTQKFHKGFLRDPEFQECLMFINSSENIDSNPEYSEKLKEGLMSGIVFTEIDHNYVNPTSDEYIEQIKLLIKNKTNWATKKAQQNYSSEYAIFNEYMTHSVFCLYITETYEEELANNVIDKRIKLMKRRGFLKFKEFNERLIEQATKNESTLYDSYEDILAAMKGIE